jgi:hypothetical protein
MRFIFNQNQIQKLQQTVQKTNFMAQDLLHELIILASQKFYIFSREQTKQFLSDINSLNDFSDLFSRFEVHQNQMFFKKKEKPNISSNINPIRKMNSVKSEEIVRVNHENGKQRFAIKQQMIKRAQNEEIIDQMLTDQHRALLIWQRK